MLLRSGTESARRPRRAVVVGLVLLALVATALTRARAACGKAGGRGAADPRSSPTRCAASTTAVTSKRSRRKPPRPTATRAGGASADRSASCACPSGGSFTLWLVAPGRVPGFGSPCSSLYSCRQGRNVIINEAALARRLALVERVGRVAARLPPHGDQPRDRSLDRLRPCVLLGWRTPRTGDAAAVDLAPGLRAERVAARR